MAIVTEVIRLRSKRDMVRYGSNASLKGTNIPTVRSDKSCGLQLYLSKNPTKSKENDNFLFDDETKRSSSRQKDALEAF